MNESTTPVFCSECRTEKPVTAFPTLPLGQRGRDFSECRACRKARTAPRDGLAPKVADLVDWAKDHGLEVDREDLASVTSLAFHRPRVEDPTNMLQVCDNAERVHVVLSPKTGRVFAGSRSSFASASTELKTFADAARWVRMIAR